MNFRMFQFPASSCLFSRSKANMSKSLLFFSLRGNTEVLCKSNYLAWILGEMGLGCCFGYPLASCFFCCVLHW